MSTSSDFYGAPRSLFLLVTGVESCFRRIVVIPAPGELGSRLTSAGVEVAVAPVDPYASPTVSGRSGALHGLHTRLRWAAWLHRLIRRHRPDVVYINTLRGASAAVAARAAGVPCVWHLRGLETGLSRPLFRAVRIRSVRWLATRVIAVAEAVAAPLREVGVPAGRISVVYNGVDVPAELRPRAPHPPPVPVVAYLGRLMPDKGVLDFLKAASRVLLRYPNVRFRLIGGPVGPRDNPHWEAIQQIVCDTPGLADRLEFSGFLPSPLGALHDCDIVTLPSHDEGFPRAVLESMSLAKAVVATCVGGVPEAVQDGVHGLLVPPGDPARLADALQRLLASPELRDTLGRAARARVAEQFTLESYLSSVQREIQLALRDR